MVLFHLVIPQGWLSNSVPARRMGTKRRCSPAARAPSAAEACGGRLTWANLNACWASSVGVLTLKVLPHLFFTKMAFSFFKKTWFKRYSWFRVWISTTYMQIKPAIYLNPGFFSYAFFCLAGIHAPKHFPNHLIATKIPISRCLWCPTFSGTAVFLFSFSSSYLTVKQRFKWLNPPICFIKRKLF